MKKFSTCILALALGFAVAGCSKKSDPTPAPTAVSAKTTLLTTPKWRISAITSVTTFAGQSTTNTNAYGSIQTCKRDDFTQFKVDNTLLLDEGVTRCSTTDPQTKPGTWSFNAAETELTVVDPSLPAGATGQTVTAEVLQLTTSSLQVRTTTTQVVSTYTIVAALTTTYTAF